MIRTKPVLISLLSALMLLIFVNQSTAQYSGEKEAISVNLVAIDYYSAFSGNDFFNKDLVTWGAKVAYHRNLVNDVLNLEVPVSMGGAFVQNIESFTTNAIDSVGWNPTPRQGRFGIGGLLQLQYFKPTNFLVPYLSAGATASYVPNGGFHVEIPLGVGFDFKIKEGRYLQLRPEYRLGLIDDDRNNFNLNLGFKWFLSEPTPPPPPVDNDRDKDGVLNADDKCPDEAGVAALGGCPDKDKDGIADKDDLCPDVAGIADMNGCPDTDGDGITDKEDDCPSEAGPEANKGCPYGDADGDGITDNVDDCKDTPGIAAFNGCPDTDGDGIKDSDDVCPNKAGTKAMGGCPDTDGDGLRDIDDKCPNEAGPVANSGCPEVKEEVVKKLEYAAQNIQFETGSSRIRSRSYSILDEVASILKEYPAYSVSIDGHTDSSGGAELNQRLSERRAIACMDYLAKKGIDPSRMKAAGYGESQPIGDNKTAAGKQQNRRVEFNLYLK